MNYLEFFHFDNHPFAGDENLNYFFPKKYFLKITDDMINFCRFKGGIYIITGNTGVGKSTLLNNILQTLNNNDITISLQADEKTDVLKIIANKIGVDSRNINSILSKLSTIYSGGKNIIISIDKAENLSKEEFVNLYSLIKVIPNLRIILCGKKTLYKTLKHKAVSPIKKFIVKKFKIKHPSIFQTVNYISYIEKNALALSQYKPVISKPSLFLIALCTNRNIKNINYISEKSLIDAFTNRQEKVRIKNVFSVIKENFDTVKYNIYLKFQKFFFLLLLIFSLYYAMKIILDRNDLINHIEAQKSIRKQEQELRNN